MKKLAIAAFGVLALMLVLGGTAFAQTGTISGTVVDQDTNEPLAYAVVMALHPDNPEPPADQAFTDASGNYQLDVPFGDYLVSAHKFRYFPEWWQEVDNPDDATPVTVAEGTNPADINFTLTSMSGDLGTIAGTVYEAGTDDPIASATLTLHRVGDYHFHRMVQSGEDGTYLFDDIPAGDYNIDCFAEGYLLAQYPEVVTVNGDDVTGIDFHLEVLVYGTIAGTVYDADTNEPIASAHVTARLPGGPRPFVREATTAEDGTYLIDELIPGAYEVHAGKQGYVVQEYADPVGVNGDDITGIDFYLQPLVVAGISGTVTDFSTGDPIFRALVVATGGQFPYRYRWALTDENGDYFLELISGEYNIDVWAWDYVHAQTEDPIVVGDSVVTGVDFALMPIEFGSISGTVFSSDSLPISNAIVEARMAGGHYMMRARTGEDGTYMFDHVFPGSYVMRAFAMDYSPQTLPDQVVIENGSEATGIDFYLEPFEQPYDGFISGYVTDEDTNEPIANSMVNAIGHLPGPFPRFWIRRAFTDENGYYIIENLPDVDFKVLGMAEGYRAEFYDDKYSWRDADPVTPDAENINFALAPREYGPRMLAGRVIENSQPIDGAIVTATLNGEIAAITATYPDGDYYLGDLAPGDYVINVISPSEAEGSIDVSTVYDDVYDADVVLSPTSADDNEALPSTTTLYRNFPNPFNAGTNISFYLAAEGHIQLSIYNLLGRAVTTLISGDLQAGNHTITWNGLDSRGQAAASGIYLYVLKTSDQTITERMTLLK